MRSHEKEIRLLGRHSSALARAFTATFRSRARTPKKLACAISVHLGDVQLGGYWMANILRVVLTGRQLDRIMWNFLVRQLTQQVIDTVQASAFFLVGVDQPPGRFWNVGVLQHIFLGPGVLLPAAAGL